MRKTIYSIIAKTFFWYAKTVLLIKKRNGTRYKIIQKRGRKVIKRTLTFITVFTLMINLIIIGASAEIISGFSSLMFADNPQLLYQYSAPENVPEPGDTYAPILNSTTSDAAPLISTVTSQTTPGSSIIIRGEGFSNATVWAYGINNSGVAEFDKCDIVNCNDNTVTAAISDRFRYGMYLIWVENGNGISRPVRVNNTTAKWLNDYETQRGMTLSVYGENLSHDNGTNLSYVYIVGENYSSYASVSSVNPFKVTFTVPLDIPNGEYISAYYIGKPSFVNENTIEFDDAEWICESDGVSYVVNSGSSIGKTYINGAVAVVVSGKGETQYRTISSSDENTITFDRAWDILPDEDSTIMIVTPFENTVIYNNDITGPDDYCQRYNATCGIQAYGNLLDFIVKDNTFSKMMAKRYF